MNKILLKILLVSFSLSLLSCKEDDQVEIIPEDAMIHILMDIHVAEAITGRKGGLSVHRDMLRNDIVVDILEKYEIDKETFSISYQYYMEHPATLDSMYVQIIKIFEEKSDEKKKSPSSKAKKEPDSTKKLNSNTLKEVPAKSSSEKK